MYNIVKNHRQEIFNIKECKPGDFYILVEEKEGYCWKAGDILYICNSYCVENLTRKTYTSKSYSDLEMTVQKIKIEIIVELE